jgi:hypothetical protein
MISSLVVRACDLEHVSFFAKIYCIIFTNFCSISKVELLHIHTGKLYLFGDMKSFFTDIGLSFKFLYILHVHERNKEKVKKSHNFAQ